MRDRTAVRSVDAHGDRAPLVRPPTRVRRGPTAPFARSGLATLTIAIFVAAHIPLALIMDRTPAVATIHAAVTFALGLWWALSGGKLDRVAVVVCYIAGAEVLWRMTDAQVYWEFGKYGCAAILLMALLRHRRMKPPLLPAAYFMLLLPSVALSLNSLTMAELRSQLSFNLSGPFALMVCAWFFSGFQVSAKTLRHMFIALIGPALAIAAVTASGTFSGSDIVFSDASNFATSGGFGPNQVSGVLGLGALLALFVALEGTATRTVRFLMVGSVVALAVQSALTFSRGGLYMMGGGAGIAACFAIRDARFRARLVPLAVVIIVVGNYFVVPYLDAFTGGQLGVRFQDTELTGRDRMIKADIELWKENPVFGVGPGGARTFRGSFARDTNANPNFLPSGPRKAAPHTEFSRLLSEHGLFGLGALLLFVVGAVANIRRASDSRARAIVAGLSFWSALFMFSYAMRVLAPSLMFGIGFATLLGEGAATTKPVALPFRSSRKNGLRPLTAGHPALRKRPAGEQIG